MPSKQRLLFLSGETHEEATRIMALATSASQDDMIGDLASFRLVCHA
jgi:hypothetical protein